MTRRRLLGRSTFKLVDFFYYGLSAITDFLDCGHCRIRDHWHDASVQKQQRDSTVVSSIDDAEAKKFDEIDWSRPFSSD